MATDVGLEINISFRSETTNQPIAIKVDGARFRTSDYTLKFRSDFLYNIAITVRPICKFLSLQISGSDIALAETKPSSGDYKGQWNTKGFGINKSNTREDLLINIQGVGCYLQKKLQAKFYEKNDRHADGGDRIETIRWKCKMDLAGEISVLDEILK